MNVEKLFWRLGLVVSSDNFPFRVDAPKNAGFHHSLKILLRVKRPKTTKGKCITQMASTG